MVVIVEGVDRVGKTTLCDAIMKEVRGIKKFKKQRKFDIKKADNANETDKYLMLLDMCEDYGLSVLFDRLHLSDYAYGLLERGYDLVEAIMNLKSIDEKLCELSKTNKVVMILVVSEDISRSSREHGKDLRLHQKMMKCAFEMSNVENKLICTYSTIEEVAKKVGEMASV